MRIHWDIETRSGTDLRKHGLRRYVRDPEFKVTLSAWAEEDGPVQVVEGWWFPAMPGDTIHIFNNFEYVIAQHMGVDVGQYRWRDGMAFAYARGFSGGLDKVGEQVGIPRDQQKLKEGGRLVRKFGLPRRPSLTDPSRWWSKDNAPEDWERFKDYNRMDVEAERAIWRCLREYPWTWEEQALWRWDQEVNARGLPVDVPLVRTAIEVANDLRDEAEQECLSLTGGIAPSEVAKLLEWLNERGAGLENLQRGTLEQWLNEGE
jgi:DNA polymerase